jgi:hypothetical protein
MRKKESKRLQNSDKMFIFAVRKKSKKSGYEEDTYAHVGGSSRVSALPGSGEVRSERWLEPDKYVF